MEQNIVLRWVSEADLPALHAELRAIGLGAPGAGTIVDVTSCPGTDTCKLGIASSRGLAGELRTRLAATAMELDEAVRGLRIKVSGCFNSCGQHHVADIGFFGNSRKIDGYTVPHFQVVLGGRWRENARLVRPADRRRPIEARSPRSSRPSRAASSPSAPRARASRTTSPASARRSSGR